MCKAVHLLNSCVRILASIGPSVIISFILNLRPCISYCLSSARAPKLPTASLCSFSPVVPVLCPYDCTRSWLVCLLQQLLPLLHSHSQPNSQLVLPPQSQLNHLQPVLPPLLLQLQLLPLLLLPHVACSATVVAAVSSVALAVAASSVTSAAVASSALAAAPRFCNIDIYNM